MDYQKLKVQRLTANLKLVRTLLALINSDNGEQRFSQILSNYGFVKQDNIKANNAWDFPIPKWADEFYLEPMQLLERVTENSPKVSG